MREDGIHRIEVHVAAVCITRHGPHLKVLALHRSPQRALFPDLWEGVGGQVHAGETLEQAVLRHLAEEAGLRGRVLGPFATYSIEPGPANARIPGVRFLVEVEFAEPRLSAQHQAWKWLGPAELTSVDWIPGLRPHIEDGLRRFASVA